MTIPVTSFKPKGFYSFLKRVIILSMIFFIFSPCLIAQLYTIDNTPITIQNGTFIYQENTGEKASEDTLSAQKQKPAILYVIRGTILSGISDQNNVQVIIVEKEKGVSKKREIEIQNISKRKNEEDSETTNAIAKPTEFYKANPGNNNFYLKNHLLYSAVPISPTASAKNYEINRSFSLPQHYAVLVFPETTSFLTCTWFDSFVHNHRKTRPPPVRYRFIYA